MAASSQVQLDTWGTASSWQRQTWPKYRTVPETKNRPELVPRTRFNWGKGYKREERILLDFEQDNKSNIEQEVMRWRIWQYHVPYTNTQTRAKKDMIPRSLAYIAKDELLICAGHMRTILGKGTQMISTTSRMEKKMGICGLVWNHWRDSKQPHERKLYVRYRLRGPLFRPAACTDAEELNQKQANEGQKSFQYIFYDVWCAIIPRRQSKVRR